MTRKTRRRVVLLFSGGLDSTLSALILLAQNVDLIALSIDYPGRPIGEMRAAEAIAQELPFSMCVNVGLNTGNSLTKFPHAHSAEQGWIPYRNLLFWSIGVHKAVMLDADFVAAGHEAEDALAFSDASEEFFTKMQEILGFTGNAHQRRSIKVELPLYTADPAYLEKMTLDNLRIMNVTWSCWLNEQNPCMNCYACKTRQKFFQGFDGRAKPGPETRVEIME